MAKNNLRYISLCSNSSISCRKVSYYKVSVEDDCFVLTPADKKGKPVKDSSPLEVKYADFLYPQLNSSEAVLEEIKNHLPSVDDKQTVTTLVAHADFIAKVDHLALKSEIEFA